MKLIEYGKTLVNRFREEITFYRSVLKHPHTPWASRILLGAAIVYAVSPVDIIPDFIPVIGHLDDLLILPVLVWLAVRLIPKHVLEDCRKQFKEK